MIYVIMLWVGWFVLAAGLFNYNIFLIVIGSALTSVAFVNGLKLNGC